MRRHRHHSHHLPATAWGILIALGLVAIGPWIILVVNKYSHWVAGFVL
jgi:hypothetical protein